METKIIISTERGYPTAYDGKRHYGITFDTISIRSTIEPELGKLKKGITHSLPENYYFKITKGLDKTVAKVCLKEPLEDTGSKETSKSESFSRDDVKAMMEIARKQGVRTRDIEADKAFTDLYKRMTDSEDKASLLESQLSKAKDLLERACPEFEHLGDNSVRKEIESFLKS